MPDAPFYQISFFADSTRISYVDIDEQPGMPARTVAYIYLNGETPAAPPIVIHLPHLVRIGGGHE